MSTTAPAAAPRRPLTAKEWLICVIAAIGFAFDIYELLMLPLIVRPALLELRGVRPGTPEFNQLGRPAVLRARRWPAASSGCWAAT